MGAKIRFSLTYWITMAKYYFLISCFLWTLSGYSQDCVWKNLLEIPADWSGDVGRFSPLMDEWHLNDSKAGLADVVYRMQESTKVLQFTFSLNFPPSDRNSFRMVIGLQNSTRTDSATIVLTIGEPGDMDGVHMSYFSAGQLVSKEVFWTGAYGHGVDRVTWILAASHTGMSIRQGASKDYFIPWKEQKDMHLSISSVTLGCAYTKTRSSHFIFHHLYGNSVAGDMQTNIELGDLFISEYRYTQEASGNYIEIYNAFTDPVCLTGLRIQINGNIVGIPPLRFVPGEYILLVDREYDTTLDPIVDFTRLEFPVVKAEHLEEIALYCFDKLIHVVYTQDQKNPDERWEMVDITQPCRIDNWKYSQLVDGTPGQENSWFSSLDSAKITFRWKNTQTGIVSYPYLFLGQEDVQAYITSNHPFYLEDERGSFKLHFEEAFLPEDSVMVLVKGDFKGCGTEMISWDTVFVEYPPLKGQARGLLFTELMYDAPASCPEYVEITNMEPHAIGWDDLLIQKRNDEPIPLDLPFEWSSNETRIITKDKEGFLRCYEEVRSESVYSAPLFALTNRGARLSLLAKDPMVRTIDQISYSPAQHNAVFSDAKGIALERNIHEPENRNWRSGFVQFGYRSPGFLPDWEFRQEIDVIFSTSTIYSRQGRYPSELKIEIASHGVGGSVTIDIYDLQGAKVRTLADAVPVQGGETFIWKGTGEKGLLLSESLYLFWIYFFDVEGHQIILKKTCVLSNN